MLHEMPMKLYFMKCSEKKVSQCILAFRVFYNGVRKKSLREGAGVGSGLG